VAARQAAAIIGINEKTVKRYYDLLRRNLAHVAEHGGAGKFSIHEADCKGRLPVFGYIRTDASVSVLFPASEGAAVSELSPAYVVWADSRRALERCDLDSFRCLPHNVGGNALSLRQSEEFWLYVKKGLALYRGGFCKNFHLFLREMEFRYNNRGNAEVTKLLVTLLKHRDATIIRAMEE
jgi:transposase-like protein